MRERRKGEEWETEEEKYLFLTRLFLKSVAVLIYLQFYTDKLVGCLFMSAILSRKLKSKEGKQKQMGLFTTPW